ncbi:hypothetical protein B0H21DRAFT_777751 [Amylocystis lapponica]|nr:hypothetical protein B0H21DRAFT_777751 [Amylocystis lapponica]
MVFGGVSAMVFGDHQTLSMDVFMRKVDVRSMFFASVFVIILLVLAYLTNPNETSFRTYLTEQSFRHHLSRLDENSQDDSIDREDSGVHYTLSRRRHFETESPFHFVNRASVSLRTPKHIFHSFGILTVAAVLPSGSHARGNCQGTQDESVGSSISDSWFVGAFGRWWRGGTVHAWCRDTLANTKDAERCSSGILDLKALDSLGGYDGLPFSTSISASLRLPTNVSDVPSKPRGTERSAQRTVLNTTRSTTPPPLPKSASLPLHAPRPPATAPLKNDRTSLQRHAHTSLQTKDSVVDLCKLNTAPTLAYSPSTLLDQSPVIAEILRAVQDLRSQLTDFRAAAAESHATIQSDLDAHRERKRAEDASRLELKTRTKTLEDSKRAAEYNKRDADKRLRTAEGARDNANQRIQILDTEINTLRLRVREDEQAIVRCKEDGDAAESTAVEELTQKRMEIKVAEDVVAALNDRAKELEERIAQEEEQLRCAREQAELRKQDRSFYPLHVVSAVSEDPANAWSPVPAYNETQDPHTHINSDYNAPIDVFPQSLQVPSGRGSSGSGEHRDLSVSPRPKHLSLGATSNFRDPTPSAAAESESVKRYYRSYSGLMSAPIPSTRFSPFSDSDFESPPSFNTVEIPPSPLSSSLIPTGLINSLEGSNTTESLTGSFRAEDDAVMAPDWRKMYPRPLPVEHPALFNSSPTSITCPSFDGVDQEDPFEIRPPPPLRHRLTSDSLDLQGAMLAPNRTASDPPPLTRARSHEDIDEKTGPAHRRWFSADPKEKKGLNPEAKVFRFTKSHLAPPPPLSAAFEPLGPHASSLGIPSVSLPPPTPEADSLFSSISMRAFAPSPAEREALKRGLGGSTNASLERLPTLSEVSIASMPSSPSHVHAIATAREPASSFAPGRTLLPPGLSWLQLPLMRKAHKFSPWEDTDEAPGEGGSEGR